MSSSSNPTDPPRSALAQYWEDKRQPLLMLAGAAAVILAYAVVTSIGPSSSDFLSSDSKGYEACLKFPEARASGGERYHRLIREVAELAEQSTTPGILDQVDTRPGDSAAAPVIRDLRGFQKACERAGMDY